MSVDMLFSFDENSNLVPVGVIPFTVESFEKHFVLEFVDSVSRNSLFVSYKNYITDLKIVLQKPFSQWIGGSFVAYKTTPNDIDLVNLIDFDDNLDLNIENLIPFFMIGGSKDKYQMDAHLLAIYPVNDERYQTITLPVGNYWKKWLGHDKNENERGFIEIKF